jgi:hypothetical protein
MKQFFFTFKGEVLRVSSDKALSAMGIANKAFSLPVGAWFEDGRFGKGLPRSAGNSYKWVEGNFFD